MAVHRNNLNVRPAERPKEFASGEPPRKRLIAAMAPFWTALGELGKP